MSLILLAGSDAYAQLITMLVIFVVVLALCAYVTRWISDYQKKQGFFHNIEIIETSRLGNSKWLQILRVGQVYKALAVCKDTVTFLGDLNPDGLNFDQEVKSGKSFRDLYEKAVSKDSGESSMHRDKSENE